MKDLGDGPFIMLQTVVEDSDLLNTPLGLSERRDGRVLGLFWAAGGRETLPHDLGVKLRHLELDYSFEKSVEEEDQAEGAIVTMDLWGCGRDIRSTGLEPWNRLVDGMLDKVLKAGHEHMNCWRLQQATAAVDIQWRRGGKSANQGVGKVRVGCNGV